MIGARLAHGKDVLEIRPIVSAVGHEIEGLRVITTDGVFVVKVEPA
jgi:hypothetical protein